MGGSWDATNVADGSVAVVTPIAWTTSTSSATTSWTSRPRSPGIIKADAVAVIGVQEPDVAQILVGSGRRRSGARIAFEGNDFGLPRPARSASAASRSPSVAWAATTRTSSCRCTARTRRTTPRWRWSRSRRSSAVESSGSTPTSSAPAWPGWPRPGRLEIVRRSPTVIVDAAHNPAGAMALRDALEDSFNFAKIVGVIAILKDKDATEMLEILEPVLDHVVVIAHHLAARHATRRAG